MSDFSLPACVTLVFGRSGSGKTTFCFRYLVNAATPQPENDNPAACIFIFDWKGEAAKRLATPVVGVAHTWEQAIQSRWVVFNPYVMFGADLKSAFRWFCHEAFEASKRGPGRKVVYVDELWKFQDGQNMPAEFETLFRMGRAEDVALITSTQHPRDYHRDLRAEVTELVCFQMFDQDELDSMVRYFPGVSVAATLQPGEFVSFNVNSREELAGELW